LLRKVASSTCCSRWKASGSTRPYESKLNNPGRHVLADGVGGSCKGNSAAASSSCRQTRSANSLSNSSSLCPWSPCKNDPGNGCSTGAPLGSILPRGTPIRSLGDPKKGVSGGSWEPSSQGLGDFSLGPLEGLSENLLGGPLGGSPKRLLGRVVITDVFG
jgi:hypothetical protein